ncbi:MAG: pyridoxine 5'-phosphate synthase [Verrucomicrobiota bacterium]
MNHTPLRLGVNIDHVATLRQARWTSYPDVLEAARVCVAAGAHGITVHLREDRRHIRDADVRTLRRELTVPLNLEMANVPEIVSLALDVKPDEVCLVPERREELTTEGGLDVAGQEARLRSTVEALTGAGTQVSLFVEPERSQMEAAARLRVPFVELHTGAFCSMAPSKANDELRRLIDAACVAHRLGLGVNAGHGINLQNIAKVLRMPYLHALNIGHSIVSRAIFVGLEEAVREMLQAMSRYGGGEP